jgi:AcrR family transcriptional regulator
MQNNLTRLPIMTKRRLLPNDRKYEILTAAINIAANQGGWSKLTREAIAKEAQCAEGLISKYFGTMTQMRRTIMRSAVMTDNLSIIAQGLAAGDTYAKKADPDLKARALETLAG